MKTKHNHTFFLSLVAAGVISCCATAYGASVPAGTVLAEKQELVRNNGSEPASLDPQKVESDVEFNIIGDTFERLVAINKDGSVEPRLAEKWENQDNTVWTFHLRSGLKWSDGSPITAQDVVWSWQRLVDPKTLSPYSSYPGNMHIRNAQAISEGKQPVDTLGVKALDQQTIEITLDQPNAVLLAMLAHNSMVPISKAAVEKYQDKWTKPENIVSSGPYKVTQWVVNEKVVAERNKNYWDDAHTVVNKVTYLPLSSETADVNRYKAGEIDVTSTIPLTLFASLKKTHPDEVSVTPMLGTYYYEFNTAKAPFNDPRVRRALGMALDKDIISEKVLAQGQPPAWLVSQPEVGGIRLNPPAYASWPREKRIAEAKKLLTEAGFSPQRPLTFNLLYNTMESHQRIAIAASSMWQKNLGMVKVKLQNQEWKAMLDNKHTGNFDVVRYAWTADYDDASSFLNNMRTGDSQNTTKYSNPAYDKLMQAAAQAPNKDERAKYYQQAEDILANDEPTIPLYHYVRTHLVKPWVGGFYSDNLGKFYTKDIYIKKH